MYDQISSTEDKEDDQNLYVSSLLLFHSWTDKLANFADRTTLFAIPSVLVLRKPVFGVSDQV